MLALALRAPGLRINLGVGYKQLFLDEESKIKTVFKVSTDDVGLFYKGDKEPLYTPK